MPDNAAPVGFADFYGDVVDFFEDEVFKVTAKPQGVLNNDTDADDTKLSAALDTGPENPLFDINTNGTFTYDARYHGGLWVDETGELIDSSEIADGDDTYLTNGFDSLADGATITDVFTYRAYDGQDMSELTTVTITVTGVNDAPVAANDDAGEVASGGTITDINVLGNDTDVDIYPTPDTLTVTGLADVDDGGGGAPGGDGATTLITDAGGTVTLEGDGELSYQAAAGFFGIDTFTYTVGDGNGGTDTATVRVTVTPTNANPTAVNDFYTVDEDDGNESLGPVLVNDNDPDGDLLGAQLSDPHNTALRRVGDPDDVTTDLSVDLGGATGLLVDFDSDGNFVYNPNGDFESLGAGESAWVAFDYTAFDAEGTPYEATAVIEIQGANDPFFGNIPVKNSTVYEAGLSPGGSTDGPDTITRTFDFTTELIAASVTDPEGDAIFLVRIDSNSEGVVATAAGDTIAGSNGTFTLLDAYDNLTGVAGADGLVDGVSYTLTSNAQHADIEGHNAGIFDALSLGLTDGTLNAGGTAYTLDDPDVEGVLNNTTGVQLEVYDDITLLGQGPDGATGDPLVGGTVLFSAGLTVSDDFTFIEGADGAALVIDGIPLDFYVEKDGVSGDTAGDILISSEVVTPQAGEDLRIEGRDGDGDLWYTLTIDADGGAGTDEARWTYTQVQGPPTIVIPVDFSSVKAGGPQETLTVSNVTFDGFFYDLSAVVDDEGDVVGSLKDEKVDDPGGDDDVNPNNAGGIGVGNGNIEQAEGLLIDVSQTTVEPTAIEFLVEGVGGGIAVETLIWEAYDSNGQLVDSDTITLDLTNTLGAHLIEIDPEMAFAELYVGSTNSMDGNDKFRINQINLVAEGEADDYILPFQIAAWENADEDSTDGDVAGPITFNVEVDGVTDVNHTVSIDDFGFYG